MAMALSLMCIVPARQKVTNTTKFNRLHLFAASKANGFPLHLFFLFAFAAASGDDPERYNFIEL